jgi:hypothetical protein
MSTASRRVVLPLPPSGNELIEQVISAIREDLKQFFRASLAYPNANFKVNWAATFYSVPFEYQGQTAIKIIAEGQEEAALIQAGQESDMQASSLEIGLQSGSTPPAVVKQGIVSQPSQPLIAESAGRRDLNARCGAGVDFLAGQPVMPNLATMQDDSKARAEVARILSDIPKSDTGDAPLAENTILTVPAATTAANSKEK